MGLQQIKELLLAWGLVIWRIGLAICFWDYFLTVLCYLLLMRYCILKFYRHWGTRFDDKGKPSPKFIEVVRLGYGLKAEWRLFFAVFDSRLFAEE